MKVGLCTISSKEDSVENIAQIARRAGADGIEVWGDGHIGDDSPERCQQISSTGSENGLEIPVYGSYLRPGSSDFDDRLSAELETADALDATFIRVWAGEQEYQNCTDEHWERTISDLDRLGDAAERVGIAVTVERHAGTVTNRTDGAAALIDQVDRPEIGLNWQPLFEHGPEAVIDDAERLADRTNNVHMQAVYEPETDERCALADAYFDVDSVLRAFERVGFDGYVELEFVTQRSPYEAAVTADIAFLRSLLDE